MAHSDREFYTYHFPGMLESWFDKQLKDWEIKEKYQYHLD